MASAVAAEGGPVLGVLTTPTDAQLDEDEEGEEEEEDENEPVEEVKRRKCDDSGVMQDREVKVDIRNADARHMLIQMVNPRMEGRKGSASGWMVDGVNRRCDEPIVKAESETESESEAAKPCTPFQEAESDH